MSKSKKQIFIPGTFLNVADVHIGSKLFNLVPLEDDIETEYAKAADKAIELECQYFVVSGDLFDTNKPTAYQIDFVASINRKLRKSGVTPVAIAGDHDKTIDDKSWVQIAGFDPINSCDKFAGVDYNDDPAVVMKGILNSCTQTTEWIFAHGMVRDLWPFCEEKKLLPLREFFLEEGGPALKGFILGDIHKPFEDFFTNPTTGQKVYCGYCGSLGVTRLDELQKKGYLYYDGIELKRIPYELERKFVEITITPAWLDALSEVEKAKIVATLAGHKKQPVVIVWYTPDVATRLNELAFLYDHAVVRTSRLKQDGSREVAINIRSELKTDDKIEGTLRQVTTIKSERTFDLALQLLRDPEGAKGILDKFREVALA
jgi:hypothetical protein